MRIFSHWIVDISPFFSCLFIRNLWSTVFNNHAVNDTNLRLENAGCCSHFTIVPHDIRIVHVRTMRWSKKMLLLKTKTEFIS